MKNKRGGKDIKVGKDRCFIIYKEMHFSFDIYSKEHHCLECAYMFQEISVDWRVQWGKLHGCAVWPPSAQH